VAITCDNAEVPTAADDSAAAELAEDSRQSGAAWVRPALAAARRWGFGARSLGLSVLAAALLAAGGWVGTGAVVESDSRQLVANRWAELRTCLLGTGLPPGARPSQLLRSIQLSATLQDNGSQWPRSCVPYAEQLDRALASPTMRTALGVLPQARELLSAPQIVDRGAEIDALFAALEAAQLPLPKNHRAVPQPPAPAQATLHRSELGLLGTTPNLHSMKVTIDPQSGQVARLLLDQSPPLLCSLNAGPRDQRWARASCRSLASSTGGQDGLRLARSEPGSADLVYRQDVTGKDGFYDVASGLRVWRPRDARAQAVVRKSGVTTVLYAETRGEGIDRHVTSRRLVHLRPGRAPSNRRLPIPRNAQTLLLPHGLMWWAHSDSERGAKLFGQRLSDSGPGADQPRRWLGKRELIGRLPTGSRHVADCASGTTQAVLFSTRGSEPRHTLLFREQAMFQKLVDVGVVSGAPALSCHGDTAILLQRRGNRIARMHCTIDGCRQASTSPLPGFDDGVAAVAPIGPKLILVWTRPGEPVRLRMGAPDTLHQVADELLFDDEQHDGLEPIALRLVSNNGLALLLLSTRNGSTYGVRIPTSGRAAPLQVVRW